MGLEFSKFLAFFWIERTYNGVAERLDVRSFGILQFVQSPCDAALERFQSFADDVLHLESFPREPVHGFFTLVKCRESAKDFVRFVPKSGNLNSGMLD